MLQAVRDVWCSPIVVRSPDALLQRFSASSRPRVWPHRWSRRFGPLVVVVAVLALMAGCGASGGSAKPTDDGGSSATVVLGGESAQLSRVRDASAALCRARTAATIDAARARALFYDHAHEMLHAIARQLEQVDRTAAARLLEQKEKVEADLDTGTTATLGSDLAALAATARAGLAQLSIEVPRCT